MIFLKSYLYTVTNIDMMDDQDIVKASGILDISEYDIFIKSYQIWHKSIDKRMIEYHYNKYFKSFRRGNAILPYWVRDYIRGIIK